MAASFVLILTLWQAASSMQRWRRQRRCDLIFLVPQ
jgi:hypothetical protein